MDITKIRRQIALIWLALLLAATIWIGLFLDQPGDWQAREWIHALCLTQTIPLAFCAVYGPSKFVVRLPFLVAWGLAIGFTLAKVNMISTQGRASLAAGAILVVSGSVSPLIIFAAHRWRTSAMLTYGLSPSRGVPHRAYQLSLRMLMILTTAFALTWVVARAAITAQADPFGSEHDILVIHAWLGFFPCLAAAPVLLVVFRPSWRIALAGVYFVLVTLADPLLFAFAAPVILNDKTFAPNTTWDMFREIARDTFQWHGQAVIAVVIYALLARAAGINLGVPDQSNDKNPNPAGEPATEAGCVQD